MSIELNYQKTKCSIGLSLNQIILIENSCSAHFIDLQFKKQQRLLGLEQLNLIQRQLCHFIDCKEKEYKMTLFQEQLMVLAI